MNREPTIGENDAARHDVWYSQIEKLRYLLEQEKLVAFRDFEIENQFGFGESVVSLFVNQPNEFRRTAVRAAEICEEFREKNCGPPNLWINIYGLDGSSRIALYSVESKNIDVVEDAVADDYQFEMQDPLISKFLNRAGV